MLLVVRLAAIPPERVGVRSRRSQRSLYERLAMSTSGEEATSYGGVNDPISGAAETVIGRPIPIDVGLESFKSRCDWFVVATTTDGQQRICGKKDLRNVLGPDILTGLLKSADEVRVYSKTKDGRWNESTHSLGELALLHLKLRVFYEPVWTHAQIGLLWGCCVGIGFAMLNSLALYGMQDPLVAVCLGAAALALFVPKIGPTISAVLLFGLGLFGRGGPVFGTLAGVVVFCLLAGLTGMAMGGAVGWVREEKLPRAPGVPAEGGAGAVKAFVLPLIGSLAGWGVFFFAVYPWAAGIVGSSAHGLLAK